MLLISIQGIQWTEEVLARMSANGNNTRHPSSSSCRRSPYAVLNLSQSSLNKISDESIRDSYKRLSRLLHPDKRPPGKERDDAQELFIELQHAYEILVDPALRQAYDEFGFAAVDVVRHNRYSEDSLYQHQSTLHDEGKEREALEILIIVLEDKKRKQSLKEWDFNANIDVHMHACNDGDMMDDWPDVTSTNVSLTASVPIPTQTTTSVPPTETNNENQVSTKKQKMKLDIGGHSSLSKGSGTTQGLLSATYQPVDQTTITSDLAFGRNNIETSMSTSTQLVNGTDLSAKVTNQYDPTSNKDGNIGFGFSSNRSLSLWQGRSVHAMFALGLTSNTMQYAVISATTWGFNSTTNRDESDKPLPRLSAKLTLGSQFPFECSIDQSHLSDSPYRSGRASVAWSPIQGYKLKAMLSRKIPLRQCKHHDSEFASNLVLGVEHTGLSGLKWIIRYQRPEGLTIKIPVVVCSFLSPVYWNRVIFVSASSILLDEVIGGLISNSEEIIDGESDTDKMHKKVSKKLLTCQNEMKWLNSSQSKQAAGRQLSFMIPVANMKRQREESNNGLVIMKATYSSTRTSVDVTHQLQFYVNESKLCLPPSPKSLLLGFYELVNETHTSDQLVVKKSKSSDSTIYDVIYQWIYKMNTWLYRLGMREEEDTYLKEDANRTEEYHEVTLSIRYRYRKEVFETTVRDTESLEIPSNSAIKLGKSNIVS